MSKGQWKGHVARMVKRRRKALGVKADDIAEALGQPHRRQGYVFEWGAQLPTDEQLEPLATLLEIEVVELVALRFLDRMGVCGNLHTLNHAKAIAEQWLEEQKGVS